MILEGNYHGIYINLIDAPEDWASESHPSLKLEEAKILPKHASDFDSFTKRVLPFLLADDSLCLKFEQIIYNNVILEFHDDDYVFFYVYDISCTLEDISEGVCDYIDTGVVVGNARNAIEYLHENLKSL